jgi:hypothetical protein
MIGRDGQIVHQEQGWRGEAGVAALEERIEKALAR